MNRPTLDDLGREAAVGSVALVPTVGVVGLLVSLLGVPSTPSQAMASGVIVGIAATCLYLATCEVVEAWASVDALRGGSA
jgi:hypothetical protein